MDAEMLAGPLYPLIERYADMIGEASELRRVDSDPGTVRFVMDDWQIGARIRSLHGGFAADQVLAVEFADAPIDEYPDNYGPFFVLKRNPDPVITQIEAAVDPKSLGVFAGWYATHFAGGEDLSSISSGRFRTYDWQEELSIEDKVAAFAVHMAEENARISGVLRDLMVDVDGGQMLAVQYLLALQEHREAYAAARARELGFEIGFDDPLLTVSDGMPKIWTSDYNGLNWAIDVERGNLCTSMEYVPTTFDYNYLAFDYQEAAFSVFVDAATIVGPDHNWHVRPFFQEDVRNQAIQGIMRRIGYDAKDIIRYHQCSVRRNLQASVFFRDRAEKLSGTEAKQSGALASHRYQRAMLSYQELQRLFSGQPGELRPTARHLRPLQPGVLVDPDDHITSLGSIVWYTRHGDPLGAMLNYVGVQRYFEAMALELADADPTGREHLLEIMRSQLDYIAGEPAQDDIRFRPVKGDDIIDDVRAALQVTNIHSDTDLDALVAFMQQLLPMASKSDAEEAFARSLGMDAIAAH